MKNMMSLFRIFSLLLVIAVFTGCSKEQLIVGKWFSASFTYYQNDVEQSTIANNVEELKQNDNYEYIFNEDKTGVYKDNDHTYLYFTYEIQNDKLIIDYEDLNLVENITILELTANSLVLKYVINNSNNYWISRLVK